MEVLCKAIQGAGGISQEEADNIARLLTDNPDIFWGTTVYGGFAVAYLADKAGRPVMALTGKFVDDEVLYAPGWRKRLKKLTLRLKAARCKGWAVRKMENSAIFESHRFLQGREVRQMKASGGRYLVVSKMVQYDEDLYGLRDDVGVSDEYTLSISVLIMLAHIKKDNVLKTALERSVPSYHIMRARLGFSGRDDESVIDFDNAIQTTKMLASV